MLCSDAPAVIAIVLSPGPIEHADFKTVVCMGHLQGRLHDLNCEPQLWFMRSFFSHLSGAQLDRTIQQVPYHSLKTTLVSTETNLQLPNEFPVETVLNDMRSAKILNDKCNTFHWAPVLSVVANN